MSDFTSKSLATSLRYFWDILCLRRGPEDLPASWLLLIVTVAAQPLFALLLGAIVPPLPDEAGMQDHSVALLLINIAVPLAWGWLILQMARRPERFLQTMTAAFGCQLVIFPLLVPAYLLTHYFDKESGWFAAAQMLLLGLSVWLALATARIIRSATDWPFFSCVALVITQSLATYAVVFTLFPDVLEQLRQAV